MMTPSRRFSITKPHESKGVSKDAYNTVKELSEMGIKISTSTLYRMKQGENKLVKWPKSISEKFIAITCNY